MCGWVIQARIDDERVNFSTEKRIRECRKHVLQHSLNKITHIENDFTLTPACVGANFVMEFDESAIGRQNHKVGSGGFIPGEYGVEDSQFRA